MTQVPLRWKMSLVFSTLFAIVLALTALLVFTNVKKEMNETLLNGLENTSDLIKRIVEVSIDNNWGHIEKNLTVAELMVDTSISVSETERYSYDTYNEFTQTHGSATLSDIRIGDTSVSEDGSIVDRIQERTGGVVAFYQLGEDGFVSIATTIDAPSWDRGVGSTIPRGTPLFELVMRNERYVSRDYFANDWYITAHRLVFSDAGKIVGALYVAIRQVNMDALERDILSITVGDTGSPFILDIVGSMVIHPTLQGQNLRSLPHIRTIANRTNGTINYRSVLNGGEAHIATFRQIPAMNWIVVAGAAENDFFGNLKVLNSVILLIFVLATIAAFVLSVVIAGRITEPIGQIKEKIKEISEGEADLEKHLDVPSNDEVGDLARYFNTFMANLRSLDEMEHREEELRLRDAQMNALQAQINPHFLYNTLETIRFMIAMNDSRSQEMVKYVADLFRISIGKGERYVKIRDEIEHVTLYIEIQKMRYPQRFSVVFNIDEDIYELYTIKFILQPIVENAIHHGFELIESGGRIEIAARIDTDVLVLTVDDNGCGMTETQLSRLRESLEEAGSAGSVGLPNVCARLRLHFGPRYGVWIESTIATGTHVTLTLPLLSEIPDEVFVTRLRKRKFSITTD